MNSPPPEPPSPDDLTWRLARPAVPGTDGAGLPAGRGTSVPDIPLDLELPTPPLSTGATGEPSRSFGSASGGRSAPLDERSLGSITALDNQVTVIQASVALARGTVLRGKFEVQQVLGKPGGFGIAYLARDIELDRLVVLKELFPYGLVTRHHGSTQVGVLRGEPGAQDFNYQLQMLLDEARRLAALDQVDSVVKVYDHFTQNNTGYIVMRHVQGRTLAERLQETGPVDPARLMRWVWPLLDGLEAVHDAGVLHRDIKPDNVLVDARDQPVLIDFGNAAALRRSAPDNGYFAVSPYYGAPEQYTNEIEHMGPWTDLYSVGALMYFALTGKRPVDSSRRRQGQPLPALRSLLPALPADLAAAVEACLQLQPEERPSSVKALKELLARYRPSARRWTEALPDTALGARIHRIDAAVQAGRTRPTQWNTAAALGQGAWLLLHQQTGAGLALLAWAVLAPLAVMWGGDPWARLPVGLALGWLLPLVPCGLWADWLLWRGLSQVGAALPLETDTDFAHAQGIVTRAARPHARLALALPLLPMVWAGSGMALQVRLDHQRQAIGQAVSMELRRDEFKAFVARNGRAPVADDLPPFTPNSEISRVEFRPSGLEVVLALDPVQGRRVRWLLRPDGKWQCQAVDLPDLYVPIGCDRTSGAG